MKKQLIKIAHSPDTDDAFMFYALQSGKIVSEKYAFEIERRDIEELNRLALKEIYDITALSIHAYAHLADRYYLTASGASMAEKDYGPLVVSKKKYSRADIKNITVAVPGAWTTACLVLKLMEPGVKTRVVPFEKIIEEVLGDRVDAGLLIHEAQIDYEQKGLHKVCGIIDFWNEISGGVPLPLGGSAVKKSLGLEVCRELSRLQQNSIRYALEHPSEARDAALKYRKGLTPEAADRYLGWYANTRSLDLEKEGKEAVELLFKRAYEQGLFEDRVKVEIV